MRGGLIVRRIAITAACLASLVAATTFAPHRGGASTAPTSAVASSTLAPTAGEDQPGEPIELGLAPLLLIGPAVTGAGDRPEFSWEPVAGAASYALAILSVADEPLWAWEGAGTVVILGGWPTAPTPAAPGPLLTVDSKWFVVAFDPQGLPIANSVMRPVAP